MHCRTSSARCLRTAKRAYDDAMWQIRHCTEADFEDVFELLKQLWPSKELSSTALRSVYERALAEHQHYICAVDANRIVGFCSLTVKNSLWQGGYMAHVDELVVDEHYRGRGIGRALLAEAIRAAQRGGCSRIELDSAFHRTGAHEFYEAQGFENRAYLFSRPL